MAGAELWILATCRGGRKHVLEIYNMGFKYIGPTLSVMLGFTHYTSVYFNISFFGLKFQNLKMSKCVKA